MLCCLFRKKAAAKKKNGKSAASMLISEKAMSLGMEVESGGDIGDKLVHFDTDSKLVHFDLTSVPVTPWNWLTRRIYGGHGTGTRRVEQTGGGRGTVEREEENDE
ncbi:hypothetical protein CRG98_011034 [Punica granatum]|nr:hypothetical protein CRG98_011034 [Punica granatum]